MSGRAAFLLVAAAALGVVLFTAVVRPAVERGGFAELVFLAVAIAAILLAERWLRTR